MPGPKGETPAPEGVQLTPEEERLRGVVLKIVKEADKVEPGEIKVGRFKGEPVFRDLGQRLDLVRGLETLAKQGKEPYAIVTGRDLLRGDVPTVEVVGDDTPCLIVLTGPRVGDEEARELRARGRQFVEQTDGKGKVLILKEAELPKKE